MVAQQEISIGQSRVQVTISIGLASIDIDQALSLDVFIDRADKALYLAKRQGRSRVVAWNQNEKVVQGVMNRSDLSSRNIGGLNSSAVISATRTI